MTPRIAAVLLACALWQGLPNRPTITVSAAASLTDALASAAEAYGRAGNGSVRFNFGGSNALARQILDGAPADVFISADEAQMDVLDKASMVLAGSRVNLLANQLAVVVPNDRKRTMASMRALTNPAIKRIAIGDPDAVPAGVYTRQYLESIGLWNMLQPKMVPSPDVRVALAAVETGAADAGIVYRTDARIATRATVAYVLPVNEGPRIVYPAAIVKTSRQPEEARRFLDFLRSEHGRTIFERFGFAPLS